MELYNEILYGMKTGQYWFITAAAIVNIMCIMILGLIENQEFRNNDERVKALNFGARLVLASMAMFVCFNLYVMLPADILKYVVVAIGIVTLILIIKVDELPVWEERND